LVLIWAATWAIMFPFSLFCFVFTRIGEGRGQVDEASVEHRLFELLRAVTGPWPIACLAMPPLAYFIWKYGPRHAWWMFLALLLLWPAAVATILWLGLKAEA
jgi:hypothetical protein